MKLELKNGLTAKLQGGKFIIKAGSGFMRVFSETFDKNHYHYKLCTKRFSDLSTECQEFLLHLESTYPNARSFATNKYRKEIQKFYYELTGTLIYVYSSFDCGISIDSVRRYLVDEGIITAESL